MKIIVAGAGKVGATLIRQLSTEDCDLTLIDVNSRKLEHSMNDYDIMAVQGNCAAMDTLIQAGVREADLLIAATNADEVNLLCCLTAHGINPNLHTIARIRNPEYTEQIYRMREQFALSMTINPEKQAAAEIARLIRYPGFLKRDTFAKGRVEIVELRIGADSKLAGVPLKSINSVVNCKVLVCVVLRGGNAVTPRGDFVLQPGDRIFVTAPAANLTVLLNSLGILTKKVKRVILCGGGRVSYYLAERLLQSGIKVEIIENSHERCVQLAGLLPGASIVEGDATNQELLENEGVQEAGALVSMTGLDEMNMVISLYATNKGVPQVITKLGRMESGSILGDISIGSTVCPKELCCNNITRYVRAMQNGTGAAISVHTIADGQAEAVEFRVDETTHHCGVPLKDLRFKPNVLIACITRSGDTQVTNGESFFQIGDSVVLVTSRGQIVHQLNDIFV